MNTVIIDKILIVMIDNEHSKIIQSSNYIDLVEGTTEYYDKKIEKALTSSTKKDVVVGENHALFVDAQQMLESDELFKEKVTKISNELFELGKKIDEMPNSNILFIECKVDGKKYILILKLNYKMVPMSIIEEINGQEVIKFVNRQMLPPKTSSVDEAIIINIEDKQLSIIEKRFVIDGKPGYYLNDQYIKGEPKLTDKQKMSLVNKVVRKVDGQFNVVDGDPLPLVKQELVNLVMEHQPIKPIEIAKKIVQNDYNACQEVEIIMQDLGIVESDTIENMPGDVGKLARCKLVLDNDKILELDVEDYLNGEDVSTELSTSGFTTLTIKNIKDIIIK